MCLSGWLWKYKIFQDWVATLPSIWQVRHAVDLDILTTGLWWESCQGERPRLWSQRHAECERGHCFTGGCKASLAQLAEHALRKRMVMGSSPIGGYGMCDSCHVRGWAQAKLRLRLGIAHLLSWVSCFFSGLFPLGLAFLWWLCDFTSLYFQLFWPRLFIFDLVPFSSRAFVDFVFLAPFFFWLSFSPPPLRSPWPHSPPPPTRRSLDL